VTPIEQLVAALVRIADVNPWLFLGVYVLASLWLVVGAVACLRRLVAWELQLRARLRLRRTRRMVRILSTARPTGRRPAAARPATPSSIADFVDEPRTRPSWQSDAGPRDW
jgi:hypothetical protein